MKQIIAILVMCLSVTIKAKAQKVTETNGVIFTEGLSWEQVLIKAKLENKYIFLDCFATWCMPCRAMDKNVYSNDTVGRFINDKFLSVKVQMDQTEHDKDIVKKWYKDVKMIEKNYTVNSLPTFLFFYPDGKPMHKAIGYKNVNDFVTEASNALNPSKQYYRILANYEPGLLDTSELKGLAQSFKNSDIQLAGKLAAEYFSRIRKSEWNNPDNIRFMVGFSESPDMQQRAFEYLNTKSGKEFLQPDNVLVMKYFKKASLVQDIVLMHLESLSNDEIRANFNLFGIYKKIPKTKVIAEKFINILDKEQYYSKENIQFLTDFTNNSTDKGFNVFYHDAGKVDSVMNIKGYARSVAEYIIDWEEVKPYLDSAVKNDIVPWKKIERTIKRKYNKGYADRIILDAKARFYEYFATKYNKHWREYIKYYVRKVERFGTDTTNSFLDATLLNNFVYDAIFLHSNDKKEIYTGLKWMEGVVRRNPKDGNHIDTYANLLYKAGRKKEAIMWQEKALKVAIDEKQDYCVPSIKGNLAKMKNDEPTWIKEGLNQQD